MFRTNEDLIAGVLGLGSGCGPELVFQRSFVWSCTVRSLCVRIIMSRIS